MMSQILLIICIMFVSLSALAADPAGKVIKVTGSVIAEDASCAKRDLARGADVFAADTITTAKDAFTTLRFTDGSVFDMASASSLKISEYNFHPDKPKEDKLSSELVQGGFRAITGTIGERSPESISAKARLTTLTVRGTGFAAGVAGQAQACGIPLPESSMNDPVAISVIQGSIDVQNAKKVYPLAANSPMQTVEVQNGQVQVLKAVVDFAKWGNIRFPTTMAKFTQEVTALPTMAPPPPKTAPQTQGGSAGGTSTESPCGTLNTVKQALPASAQP